MKDTIRLKKANRPKKGYEVYYDDVSERIVFEIHDTDGMFPFLIKIKTPKTRVYEIVQTRTGKLSMR